jgi:hypothetical protein
MNNLNIEIMKKFRTQKISKQDVYIRYLIGAALTLFVLTSGLTGITFYFLLIFTAILVFTGIVERSYLKAKFCSDM